MAYSIGLEFNYEGDFYKKSILSASLFTAYETGTLRWQAHIISDKTGINPAVKITPNHNIHATTTENILSTQLAGVTDAGIQVGIYYLKKKYLRDEQLEAFLEASFLQRQKQNDKIVRAFRKEYQ